MWVNIPYMEHLGMMLPGSATCKCWSSDQRRPHRGPMGWNGVPKFQWPKIQVCLGVISPYENRSYFTPCRGPGSGAHLVNTRVYKAGNKKLPTASSSLNLVKYQSLTHHNRLAPRTNLGLPNHNDLLVSSKFNPLKCDNSWEDSTVPLCKKVSKCFMKGSLSKQRNSSNIWRFAIVRQSRGARWKKSRTQIIFPHVQHKCWLLSTKGKIPQVFQTKKQERDSDTKPQTLHGAIFGEQLEKRIERIQLLKWLEGMFALRCFSVL